MIKSITGEERNENEHMSQLKKGTPSDSIDSIMILTLQNQLFPPWIFETCCRSLNYK
jgi:hypothetical protein